MAAVDDLRDQAIEAIEDESRWHPTKRIASRMLAEGVDLSDADAVDEWMMSGAL